MAISYQVLLINLATVEKTKLENIIELQYCTGMSRKEIQKRNLKKISFIFFNFQKIGSGGSVKQKIEKLWPNSASSLFAFQINSSHVLLKK